MTNKKSLDENACEDEITPADELKEKLTNIQNNIVDYVIENPVQAIGISLLAGIFAAQLFKSKK